MVADEREARLAGSRSSERLSVLPPQISFPLLSKCTGGSLVKFITGLVMPNSNFMQLPNVLK